MCLINTICSEILRSNQTLSLILIEKAKLYKVQKNIYSLLNSLLYQLRCIFCVHTSSSDDAFNYLLSFEGQPFLRVVYEDLVHLVLRDSPRQHLWHNALQDVRVTVAAKLCEPVFGVDVMRDNYPVLVAFFHQERQARHKKQKKNEEEEEEVKN